MPLSNRKYQGDLVISETSSSAGPKKWILQLFLENKCDQARGCIRLSNAEIQAHQLQAIEWQYEKIFKEIIALSVTLFIIQCRQSTNHTSIGISICNPIVCMCSPMHPHQPMSSSLTAWCIKAWIRNILKTTKTNITIIFRRRSVPGISEISS